MVLQWNWYLSLCVLTFISTASYHAAGRAQTLLYSIGVPTGSWSWISYHPASERLVPECSVCVALNLRTFPHPCTFMTSDIKAEIRCQCTSDANIYRWSKELAHLEPGEASAMSSVFRLDVLCSYLKRLSTYKPYPFHGSPSGQAGEGADQCALVLEVPSVFCSCVWASIVHLALY